MDTDALIDELSTRAEKLESQAEQLRRTIAVLEGSDPDLDGQEDDAAAPLSKPSRAKGGGNRSGGKTTCEIADDECWGDVLTTKPCKHCGEQHSRCEGHGGRRSAAVSHSQVHRD
jgi:hypothetical protein